MGRSEYLGPPVRLDPSLCFNIIIVLEQWTEYKVTRHTDQPKTDLKMQILQIILFTLAILTTQRILQTTLLTRLNNCYRTPVFYLVNLIIHHQHSVDEMISIILIEPL